MDDENSPAAWDQGMLVSPADDRIVAVLLDRLAEMCRHGLDYVLAWGTPYRPFDSSPIGFSSKSENLLGVSGVRAAILASLVPYRCPL